MDTGDTAARRCLKCDRPRARGQKLCKEHRREYKSTWRAEKKIARALAEVPPVQAGSEPMAGDTRNGDTVKGDTSPGHGTPTATVVTGETGQGGNGHVNGTRGPLLRDLRTPLPRWRVGTKTLLAALGRNDAEGLRALMDGIVRCAKSENPWVTLALWRDLRDALEGHPGKAPEPPAERQLGRIVLHPGPDPSSPPAEPAVTPEALGSHEEGGDVFVSVPPPAE